MSGAFNLTVFVTILALVAYIWTMISAGRAREKCGVKAPATQGPEEFNRAFRVQQNTLEQIVLFLPALWLCYALFHSLWPAVAGFLWPLGRIIYARTYVQDPAKRGLGFALTFFTSAGLLVAALVGVVLTCM